MLLPAFAAEPPAARLHAAARNAVEGAKTSRYEHSTDINAEAGRYICDCSGFVVYLLRQTLPLHLEPIPKEPGRPRANAANFHNLAARLPASGEPQNGWSRVFRLTDAQAGDVLVWRHNDPKPGSTGHVMIIDAAPQKQGDQYRLTIMDSARSPHANDTRSAQTSGIGRGDIFLTVDQDLRPQAWRWASPTGKLHEESICVLRAVEK
ncbi:MAG: hypothetical protein ACKO8Z_08595 [Prosthecobacter sp.]